MSLSAVGLRICRPRVAPNRMNRLLPSAASRAGSANSAATSRPTLVARTSGSARVRPGKVRSSWPEQLVLGSRPQRDPAGAVRRPRRQLGQDRTASANRQAATGQQQLGHRLQVDRIGLDRPLAQHPALLGDMPGVELEQLPAGRPGLRREQRPVVVPGRFDPDLDPGLGRQQGLDLLHDLAQRRCRHRTAELGPEQHRPGGVGDRHRELVLADIDRDDDRRRRDRSSLNHHETHLRGRSEDHGAATPGPSR